MDVKELIVELSRNCNLSCIMCGFGGQPIKKEWFMELSLLEKVLHEFGSELKVIRLNGRGESTLHPNFLDFVELTRLHCPNASLHLFTNLSWDRPEIIELFGRYQFQLFVSIDSPDEELLAQIRRGCRPDLITSNLEALKSLENRPFMVATLQEKNLHQIVHLALFAAQYRCNLIFNTVRYDDGSPELDAMIREQQEKLVESFKAAEALLGSYGLQCHCPDQMHGIPMMSGGLSKTTGGGASCPSLNRELFISYNGKVHPCNMFHPYMLGDLQIQSFRDVLLSRRWSWFEEHHFESAYCNNCAHLKAEV